QTIEREQGDLSITLRHVDQHCGAGHIGKIIVLLRKPGFKTIDRRSRNHSYLAADRAFGAGGGLLRRKGYHEAALDWFSYQCTANCQFAVASVTDRLVFKGLSDESHGELTVHRTPVNANHAQNHS